MCICIRVCWVVVIHHSQSLPAVQGVVPSKQTTGKSADLEPCHAATDIYDRIVLVVTLLVMT